MMMLQIEQRVRCRKHTLELVRTIVPLMILTIQFYLLFNALEAQPIEPEPIEPEPAKTTITYTGWI
jgi:hypothetical protein